MTSRFERSDLEKNALTNRAADRRVLNRTFFADASQSSQAIPVDTRIRAVISQNATSGQLTLFSAFSIQISTADSTTQVQYLGL
jgi:hypothetical protein